jgi:hypothetical protein
MKQIFHIFRKDVRHHWIVILLCQAALVFFCRSEVSSWSGHSGGNSPELIGLLLFFSWCIFIFRVVYDEVLVGDRQFWVTRPYEWNKLLAEKFLLVLVFLTLPLLVAGALLLAKAGFSPAPHVLGMLWMQLLLLQFPFLPLLALGTVTRNLTQGLLTLLAVFLFTLMVEAAPASFRAGHYMVGVSLGLYFSEPGKFSDPQGLALLLACVIAIGLQYSRRKTLQSRAWLAGGILAMLIIRLVSAYATRNTDPFPVPERQTIPFRAGVQPGHLPTKAFVQPDEAFDIGIPLHASGIPQNMLGRFRGMRVVLEAPDGYRWNGSSHGGVQLLQPGDNYWLGLVPMEYEAYKRLRSVPLKAHVTLSVDVLREPSFENVSATDGEFDVPGLGRCRVMDVGKRELRCNSPLKTPSIIVRVNPVLSTCTDQPVFRPGPVYGLPYAWSPRFGSGPADYGISPVAASFFSFWNFSDLVRICPGTPLIFSFPEFAENVRSDFDIPDFRVDDYRSPGFGNGDTKMTAGDGIRLGLPPPPR